MGIKVHSTDHLTPKRLVNVRLESFIGNETIKETWGEVAWQDKGRCGIRLAEPISNEYLELIAK
jgi:hypothetical protein